MYATSSRLLVFVCPSIFCCQRSRSPRRSVWPGLPPNPTHRRLVGLGGIEPPTSPLSGVRSSHLSYRPEAIRWWSWSGSNRRPPECKSGALPAELQPLFAPGLRRKRKNNRGQLDAETMRPAHGRLENSEFLSGDAETDSSASPKGYGRFGVERLLPTESRVHYTGFFRKLHPRSLLERR